MRLRVVPLPGSGFPRPAPYLIVLDRVPEETYENTDPEIYRERSETFVKNSNGQCHGVIVSIYDVEIEDVAS